MDRANFRSLVSSPAHFIAWGFGAGLAPKFPGTAGSVLAMAIYILFLESLPLSAYLSIVLVTIVVGIWSSHRSEALLGRKDAGVIVIDEIAGMWIALILVQPEWLWHLIAFALFRILDILKPWPISLVDKRVKGGLGIMLDDILAGGITFLVMLLLHALFGEML